MVIRNNNKEGLINILIIGLRCRCLFNVGMTILDSGHQYL